MNKILAYLMNEQEQMIETLRTIVEMESPSDQKARTDCLARRLRDIFAAVTGGAAELIPNERYGCHVRGEWGEGAEQILVVGHFDTVWPAGTIAAQPFRVDASGKIYGPGVFDMKGGLVVGFYALRALRRLGEKIGRRVVFLCNSDEEIGSPSSRDLIEAEARRSRYALVLECAGPAGTIKTARKGVGRFSLTAEGRAAHAGIDHAKGRSAVEEMARQIQYLHSLTDYELGTTVNVGLAQGGSASNVVAARAACEIDLRVWTAAEAERVTPLILGLKPQLDGVTVKVEGEMNRMPFERTERVAALYRAARRIAREELDLELGETATGGGSDGNFTAPLCPTLDGLGAIGDGAHAAGEYVLAGELARRGALIAVLLKHLQ